MLHWLAVIPVSAAAAFMVSMLLAALRRVEGARRAYYAGALLTLASWLVHLYFFVVGDYRLYEVSITSGEGMSLYYRIAASWSAGGGSLLLVATVVALASAYLARLERLSRPGYYGALSLTTLTLLGASLASGSFMESRVEGGLGLNPLLKTWWVFPHPLSTLAGYGLAIASSMVLAFTTSRAGYRALLVAWAVLTLGLALGGLWSYETFGWGGYWAWDPVETAQLMVWLAVTASLHAVGPLSSSRRPLMYAVVSSVLLALYVVRSGVSPLHSFAGESVAGLALLLGSLVFLVASIYVAAKDRSVQTIFMRLPYLLYDRSPAGFTLALAGVALQAALLVVYSSLLVPSLATLLGYNINPPSLAQGVRYYNTVLYPLFLLGLAAVPGYFLTARRSWKAYQLVLASSIAAAIALGLAVASGRLLLAPKSGLTTNLMMAVALPFAAAAVGSVAAGLLRLALTGRLRYGGGSLVHGGIALVALGVIVSGAFAWSDAYAVSGEARLGEPFSLGSIVVELEGYSYELSGDMISPRAAVAYGYNSAAMAFLALKALGDIMRLPEALAAANHYSTPLENLLGGLELGSIVAEGYGAVSVDGATLEGPVRIELSGAMARLEILGSAPSLAGSPVTVAFTFTSATVTVAGEQVGGDLIAVSLAEPIEVYAGSVIVEASSLIIGESRALVARGMVKSDSGAAAELPAVLRGQLLLKVIEDSMPDLYRRLEASGAIEASMMAYDVALRGGDSLPSWVPAGALLVFTIDIGEERLSGTIRYEANGEILGIRGLVLDVEVIRRPGGDLYLSLAPPLVDGIYNVYPEPLIYYLAELRQSLSPEEFLAYTAVIAAGYTTGGSFSEAAVSDVINTIVDLYLLTSEWGGGSGYINVMAKAVPGTSLIWLGAAIAIIGALIDAIWPVSIGHGLAVKERRG